MVATPRLKNMPWMTIVLATGAIAAFTVPGAADFLIYDRPALVRGELWRLLTAHLVHYSAAHLLSNLLVLVFAAWLLETRYRSAWLPVVALSGIAIGIGVFVFEPDIVRYAGASGVSFALLISVVLRGLAENPRWRLVCTIVLGIICLKLAAEILFGWQLVDWKQEAGFVTVTLSHAIGAGTGLLIWLPRVVRNGKRPGLAWLPRLTVNTENGTDKHFVNNEVGRRSRF